MIHINWGEPKLMFFYCAKNGHARLLNCIFLKRQKTQIKLGVFCPSKSVISNLFIVLKTGALNYRLFLKRPQN